MKPTKKALFILAGVWTILLVIEKLFSASASIREQKLPGPARIACGVFRLFKSALLFSLALANVVMAIALIDNKNR